MEPGWQNDPTGRFPLRWWNGLAWTQQVFDGYRTRLDTDSPYHGAAQAVRDPSVRLGASTAAPMRPRAGTTAPRPRRRRPVVNGFPVARRRPGRRLARVVRRRAEVACRSILVTATARLGAVAAVVGVLLLVMVGLDQPAPLP